MNGFSLVPPGHLIQVVLFWVLALVSVGSAVAMITRRNAVVASMWLVAALISVAGLFVMLYAHFIGVIQVLVYAGAVMVLFVFVVMILNKEEDELVTRNFLVKAIAVASMAAVLLLFSLDLWGLKDRAIATSVAPDWLGDTAMTFGTTRGVGRVLFTDYLFAFEAVSLVLLLAVIGGIVLARPGRRYEKLPPAGRRSERPAHPGASTEAPAATQSESPTVGDRTAGVRHP